MAASKPRIRNCAEIHLKKPLQVTGGQTTVFMQVQAGRATGHKLTADLDGRYVTIKPRQGPGSFCVPFEGLAYWKPAMGVAKEDPEIQEADE